MENQQTSEAGEEKRQMTPEEIKEKQDQLKNDYEEQIEYLKPQAEYEDLLAKIEESKYRRYKAIAATAQLFDHMEREEAAMKEFIAAQEEAAKGQGPTPEHEGAPEKAPVKKKRNLATQ